MRQRFKEYFGLLFRFFEKNPLLFIAIIIILANWQLFFGLYGIKWDSSNYWHPWRYFISECYNNGIIPVWDPYTQSGYPVHGDLQGPAYSIDAIITSFLFKGSVYSINLIFISYLIFGSFGFFKLCNLLVSYSGFKTGERISNAVWPSIMAGIIYSLSGFTDSHGHNLYIVISVGLLPWLYYYFFKILSGGTMYDAMKFAIIIFFQVTAGNPSFLIVCVYFMLFVLLINAVFKVRKKEKAELIKNLKYFSAAGLIALILCAPVLINVLLVFNDSTRAGGVSLDWAGLENSPVASLISFSSPFTGYENFVDLTIRQPILSYYVGALTLCIALIGFLHCRIRYAKYFIGFAIVAFLLSLGLKTPLFGWFHAYLPMFNVFRMPKLIFIYIIILILICFVFGLQSLIAGKVNFKRLLIYSAISHLPIIVFGIVYFYGFYDEGLETKETKWTSIIDFVRSSAQSSMFIISALIVVTLSAAMLLLIKKQKWKVLSFLIVTELIVFYNITATVRIFDEEKLSVKEKVIENLPKQFPAPLPISTLNAEFLAGQLYPFWMNTSIYLKQTGYTNNNSFALKSYAFLEDENKNEFQYAINLPLYILMDSAVTNISLDDSSGKKIAVVEKESLSKFQSLKVDSSDKIVCEKFLPQEFEFAVSAKNRVAFILQQCYNKYWKVTVNGKEIQPEIAFYNFPLIVLEPGLNKISFTYQVPYFKISFVISILLFVVLMFVLIGNLKLFKWPIAIGFASLIVFCSYSFVTGGEQPMAEEINSNEAIINTSNTCTAASKGQKKFNLLYTEEQARLIEYIRNTNTQQIKIASMNNYFPPELEKWISAEYGGLVKNETTKFGSIKTFDRAIKDAKIIHLDSYIASSDLSYNKKVDASNEFSDGIKCDLFKLNANKGDLIVIEADVKTTLTNYTGLCFSIDNAGVNKKFGATHSINSTADSLRHLVLYYTLNEEVKSGDELKAFLWNKYKEPVYLKRIDFKIIHKD